MTFLTALAWAWLVFFASMMLEEFAYPQEPEQNFRLFYLGLCVLNAIAAFVIAL